MRTNPRGPDRVSASQARHGILRALHPRACDNAQEITVLELGKRIDKHRLPFECV